mmetsp:Transcript_25445/g.58859  ORF Transcript_25445/g.58859 Transcript_25445/m.58859 type:complete len:214 (-) Transcript_25445:1102-1743(-)
MTELILSTHPASMSPSKTTHFGTFESKFEKSRMSRAKIPSIGCFVVGWTKPYSSSAETALGLTVTTRAAPVPAVAAEFELISVYALLSVFQIADFPEPAGPRIITECRIARIWSRPTHLRTNAGSGCSCELSSANSERTACMSSTGGLLAHSMRGNKSSTRLRKTEMSARTSLGTLTSRSARIKICASLLSASERLSPPAIRRMPIIARSPQS